MTKRILVVGQAVHPTGYARVLHSLLPRLAASYEIHQLAINYKGAPLNPGWSIHPNRVVGDILGVEQLRPLLEAIQPDLVFMLHDLYLYEAHKRTLDRYAALKTVVYCPIDGEVVDPEMFNCVQGLDRLVIFNNFAAQAVHASLSVLRAADPAFVAPACAIIPHGVDTTSFYPLAMVGAQPDRARSRHLARQILFPEQPALQDAFIVLNANRNQPRKRIDLTLEAFARFAQDKPEQVKLYLHMGMRDRGCDVLALARVLGIEERLLLTTREHTMPHVADELLNLIYNACDVGFNTATGEGWGLVAFEHAATGAAQILPRHSACADLWQQAAVFVEPVTCARQAFDFMEHRAVLPGDVAAQLDRLYREPHALAEYAARAYAHATQAAFNWDVIAAQWHVLFQTVLASRTPA